MHEEGVAKSKYTVYKWGGMETGYQPVIFAQIYQIFVILLIECFFACIVKKNSLLSNSKQLRKLDTYN